MVQCCEARQGWIFVYRDYVLYTGNSNTETNFYYTQVVKVDLYQRCYFSTGRVTVPLPAVLYLRKETASNIREYLERQTVPADEGIVVAVGDTKVPREKTENAYQRSYIGLCSYSPLSKNPAMMFMRRVGVVQLCLCTK